MAMTLLDRMESLMKQKGISNNSELSRLSGVPYTTIDGFYKKGTDNMKLSTLRKICSCLGCSLDFLITGLEEDTEVFLTPEDSGLLDMYKDLSDEGKRKVRAYVDDIYERYKNV